MPHMSPRKTIFICVSMATYAIHHGSTDQTIHFFPSYAMLCHVAAIYPTAAIPDQVQGLVSSKPVTKAFSHSPAGTGILPFEAPISTTDIIYTIAGSRAYLLSHLNPCMISTSALLVTSNNSVIC